MLKEGMLIQTVVLISWPSVKMIEALYGINQVVQVILIIRV